MADHVSKSFPNNAEAKLVHPVDRLEIDVAYVMGQAAHVQLIAVH